MCVCRRADAQWTGRACQKDGIAYELREYADAAELDTALAAANADPDVHGVLIYYPCFGFQPSFFGGSMDDQLRDAVSTEKDVEGLTHTYRAHLYRDVRVMPGSGGVKCLLPCTPLAVVKILEQLGAYDTAAPTGRQLAGKTVTVVNRSEIVGRPLAALLANDGAAIYSVDIDSIYEMRRGRMTPTDVTPEAAVRASDIVVLGVPSDKYKLPVDWVRAGAIVVNVASHKNIDEAALLAAPSARGVRYVPLVGKVTVAMLERNLLRLYEGYHAPRRAALAAARHREDVARVEQLEQKLARFSRASLALAAIAAALGYLLGKRHLL